MHSGPPPQWKARPKAALLTLAAHALFVLLLFSDPRMGPRPLAPPQERVSIPITLLPLPVTPMPVEPPAEEGAAPPVATVPAPPRAPPPSTAITLPAPQVVEPEEPAPRASSDVDWYAQAAERAQRYVDEAAEARESFGPPVVKMREPCEPPRSSFMFKKDYPPSTGSGGLTLGWEEPPPNSHLFDDMMAGKRRVSSVPDPNKCD